MDPLETNLLAELQAERQRWFALVESDKGWKYPIDKTLACVPGEATEAMILAIHEAVRFFAGCVPTFRWTGPTSLRVQARGYYAAIGA